MDFKTVDASGDWVDFGGRELERCRGTRVP